jgi:hypothetical protein
MWPLCSAVVVVSVEDTVFDLVVEFIFDPNCAVDGG